MKKIFYSLAIFACVATTFSCSGAKNVALNVSTKDFGTESKKINLQKDKQGYITLFDGKTLEGWRGYAKDHVPANWIVEDGCLKFDPQRGEGGDIIFAHNFKNFVFEMDWKISEGGNSGIFFLAHEAKNDKGEVEAIYTTCPEYQVLDNENHPDAKLGVDGNRKAASLYDMLPAKPQNAKPHDEWNKAKIVVKNGNVEHWQNGVKVVEYKLWDQSWIDLLQKSKFSEKNWPSAFKLQKNVGGDKHEGVFGLQDHGNVVWFKNIRVKEL